MSGPTGPARSVLITGASSGLGRALAAAVAAPGVTLHLSGRDPDRLRETAALCEAAGAQVDGAVLDVTDAAAMADWVRASGRLDLVIANAGIAARGDAGAARRVMATNLDGAMNTILPAMEVMAEQTPDAAGVRGRIAAIASIAAFLPIPGAGAYCASKAALDMWMVATAPEAWRRGIRLTSVCPGYVRTGMTATNTAPMPGVMDANQAAAIILRGIASGRARLAFPWWMAAAARLGGLFPPAFSAWAMGGRPDHGAMP